MAYVPVLTSSTYFTLTPETTGDAMSGSTNYDKWGPMLRFNVSGHIPLLTFGKISNLKKMAREGIGVGKAQEQMAVAEIESLAIQAFYSFQFASRMEETLDEGGGYLARARKYIEKLRDEDDEDYDDVVMLRLRIYESDFEAQKMQIVRMKRLSLSALHQLTGLKRDAFTPAARLESVKAELKSLEDYLALAHRFRGELLALEAGMRARGCQVTYEKRNFLPDLFIGAFFSYTKSWVIDPQDSPFAYDPFNTWYAGGGLGLSWDLDLKRRLGALDEARAESRKVAAQWSAVRQQVSLEVEQAFLEVTDFRKQLKLDRSSYKAARGWVLAKLDLYESGMGDFKDLADALSAFFRRRMAFDKTKMDYNLALAKLAHACGVRFSDLTNIE